MDSREEEEFIHNMIDETTRAYANEDDGAGEEDDGSQYLNMNADENLEEEVPQERDAADEVFNLVHTDDFNSVPLNMYHNECFFF